MRKNGFIFTHCPHRAMIPLLVHRLVVCKKTSRLLFPYARCVWFFTVSFCACALRPSRLLHIDKPPAGRQKPISRPFISVKPTAVRPHCAGLQVRPSVALIGAQPKYSPLPDVMPLRGVINICCLVAVSMDWLRTNPLDLLFNDL